jgi:hypothetical protein
MMASQNKAYVIIDNPDCAAYMMPTVSVVRAMLSREAIELADDNAVENTSRDARSLVMVVLDLRVQKPPQHQLPYRTEQQYQMHAQPSSAHGAWNGFGQASQMHPSHQIPAAVHGYMPSFAPPPVQGSVLSQWGQPRQAQPPPPGPPPTQYAEAWMAPQSGANASWGAQPAHSAPPPRSAGGQGWGGRRY